MMIALLFILCIVFAVRYSLEGERSESDDPDQIDNAAKIKSLNQRRHRHKLAAILSELIEHDGAGAWPPKANHDSWPLALRPYKDIYLELSSHLPAAQASLIDEVNQERCAKYRSSMQNLLQERINITDVKTILSAVEAGDWSALPRDQYNGFYCCIAVLRHAYRWATIPVVRVAQLEKIVDFPPELDAPWPFLQATFGIEADSGNNTANVLHNFDERGDRVYKINVGMSDTITSSEEVFFRMFYDLEILAFPIYYHMAMAVISFGDNDKALCRKHLRNVTSGVRDLLLIFYRNLTDNRVSHSVWLSYIQGFQGWGVGRMIDGEYVKFDGLSGNHVLFFQALDAFLGMDRYLTDQNMDRYIPLNQRSLCFAFRSYSFRDQLEGKGNEGIKEEMTKIVNHLKVFRAAHRARVMSYLEQPAPERLTMTAGKSVLEGSDVKQALKVLDDMLINRLKQTI